MSAADGIVLIVDDEPQIRRVVRNALKDMFTGVVEARTGSEALDLAASKLPLAIVLDLGLPDMPGVEVCRTIRTWSTTPILVLSARHSESEKVQLLDAGADDYITKPFSAAELQARLRAQLRRARTSSATDAKSTIVLGDLAIDLAKPVVKLRGEPVHLTKTEWDLLRALIRERGRTQTHAQLFTAVWGSSFGDAQQNLRVHIRSLRRKIETDPIRPEVIVTEPGVGYRFELDE